MSKLKCNVYIPDTGIIKASLFKNAFPGDAFAFDDRIGHGTGVTSIYAANTDAKIIVYNHSPLGKHDERLVFSAFADSEKRIRAAPGEFHLINTSFHDKQAPDSALGKELKYWGELLVEKLGAMWITSASNASTGQDVTHLIIPAGFEWATVITALGNTGLRIAEYSNYGSTVDFCAPGRLLVLGLRKSWAYETGTSYAAPYVGVQAIRIAQYMAEQGINNNPKDMDVYAAMRALAVNMGDEKRYGHGKINTDNLHKLLTVSLPPAWKPEPEPEPEPEPKPEPDKEEEPPVNAERRERLIEAVLDNMELMLGTDYSQESRNNIWPNGSADCSSLVAAAWSAAGFPLLNSSGDELRTSYRQVAAVGFDLVWPSSKSLIGKNLPSPSGLLTSYAREGDIAFWNFDTNTTRANKITHVGMIHRNGLKIIHTANNREKCCTKPLTYGDGHICAIIRLRADFSYPALPDIYKPDGNGRADEWLVRMLQTALNFKFGSKLVVDGSFGGKTAEAVVAFNKTIGLYSALCSWQTWTALGLVNNGGITDPVPEPEPEPLPAGAVHAQTIGTVRLRKGPGTEHDSIGTSAKDASLLVLPALENGWRETAMEYQGHLQVGYMSAKYIREA